MKQKPSTLQRQIRRTLAPIISGRLVKVKQWKSARVLFKDLSTDDQMDILEEVQKLMDYEVQRQIKKAKNLKKAMTDDRQVKEIKV